MAKKAEKSRVGMGKRVKPIKKIMNLSEVFNKERKSRKAPIKFGASFDVTRTLTVKNNSDGAVVIDSFTATAVTGS
jgi:hypothetical protein